MVQVLWQYQNVVVYDPHFAKVSRTFELCLKYFLLIDTDLMFENANKKRKNFVKDLYNAAVILFHVIVIARYYRFLTIDDDHELCQLGEIYRFIGGDRTSLNAASIAFNICALIVNMRTIWMHHSTSGRRSIQNTLLVLSVIAGSKSERSIGLSKSGLSALRTRATFCCLLLRTAVIGFVAMFFFYVPYIYATHYELARYWPYVLFWKLFTDVWLALNMGAIAIGLTYFYIICYSLKLRVNEWVERVTECCVTSFVQVDNYNAIVAAINQNDRYWQYFVFGAFCTFVPLTALMLYIVFVSNISNQVMRLLFFVSSIEFVSLLSFTCLSAASVAAQVNV